MTRKYGFAAAALLLGVSVAGTSWAQLGNGTNGAGSVAAGPKNVSSAGEPVGPGKSRLPLTTPEAMPFENTKGSLSATEKPGSTGDAAVGKQAYGSATEKWPYTTARVAISSKPFGNAPYAQQVPVTSAPYRFTGKLWMHFSDGWYVCTASLIKKGVLVTAAHCVHNYGQQAAGWADQVRWYPANWAAGGGPWGYFTGVDWRVQTPYFNGTDTCQSGAIGVVCNNDIATVTLQPRNSLYAGQILGGWYAYGWNGYGAVASPAFGSTVTAITQLGYPVAIDNGYQMERNDSFGKYIQGSGTNGKVLKNTQLGSAMTGGSSGGPWMANFGTRPTITGGASLGNQSATNTVVGVTSWGYTTVGVNVQGASWFGQNAEYPGTYGAYGAGNIGSLVKDTCTANPGYC